MGKKVKLSSVIFCLLMNVAVWMLFFFLTFPESCTWTSISVFVPIIGASLTTVLILYLVDDDLTVSASSKTEPKTGMQGVWERSHPEWMRISEYKKYYPSDWDKLTKINRDFLNQFCPDCGEEMYIRNWHVSAYDPRTGAPKTKVIQVTCSWHSKHNREMSEPYSKVLL